jgi:hypothetical protein
MSTHTKSPWSIGDDGAGHYWIEGAVPGEAIIADLIPREPLAEPTEEDWANWYLMRAAPGLLKALEAALPTIARPSHQHPRCDCAPCHLWRQVRAALELAHGDER